MVSIFTSKSEISNEKFFKDIKLLTFNFIVFIFPVDNSNGIPNFFNKSLLNSTSFAVN